VSDIEDLDRYKAKWRWLGWQFLLWSPIPLIVVAILSQKGEPIAAALFLAAIAGSIKLYQLGYLFRYLWSALFWIATLVLTASLIELSEPLRAVIPYVSLGWLAPYILGMLLVPMIALIAGKKTGRLKLGVLVALGAIAAALFQFEGIHAELVEKSRVATAIAEGQKDGTAISKLRYRTRTYWGDSEVEAARAVHKKYYYSMPEDDFMRMIGLNRYLFLSKDKKVGLTWSTSDYDAKNSVEDRRPDHLRSWEWQVLNVEFPNGEPVRVMATSEDEANRIADFYWQEVEARRVPPAGVLP
jgi:hypothetical protein